MPVGTRQNPSRSTSNASTSTSTEDICLITKDSLDMIIRDNAEFRKLHLESTHNIAKSLEKIAEKLTCTSNQVVSNSANLCQKLDGLIDMIKQNNTSFTPLSDGIDSVLKHRKTLVEKIVRHESLSKYYDELINEKRPFARKALRTKVNQNASDIDLRHRRRQTIDNVKREIMIMQDRLVDFTNKKRILEEKIEIFLQSNETARSQITDKICEDDREASVSYEKKISMMKKTDLKEKGTVTDYLLKFQGDTPKPSQDQRNPPISSRRSCRSPKKRRKENGDY